MLPDPRNNACRAENLLTNPKVRRKHVAFISSKEVNDLPPAFKLVFIHQLSESEWYGVISSESSKTLSIWHKHLPHADLFATAHIDEDRVPLAPLSSKNKSTVKSILTACTTRLKAILGGETCTYEDYELVLKTHSTLKDFDYPSRKPAFLLLLKTIHTLKAKENIKLETIGTQRLRAALVPKKV